MRRARLLKWFLVFLVLVSMCVGTAPIAKASTINPSPLIFTPENSFNPAIDVMTNPKVWLVFWGAQWNNQTLTDSSGVYTNYQAQQLLINFFQSLSGSPWVGTLTQYCQGPPPGTTNCASFQGAAYITNPMPLVKGWWVDTWDPLPANGAAVDLWAARTEAGNAFNYIHDASAIFMIFTPSGQKWNFLGSNACAWHDEVDGGPWLSFGFVPYTPDGLGAPSYAVCSNYAVNPIVSVASTGGYGDGYFDGLTMGAVHEYAEAVTDPFSGGWFDSTGYSGEIGDNVGRAALSTTSHP